MGEPGKHGAAGEEWGAFAQFQKGTKGTELERGQLHCIQLTLPQAGNAHWVRDQLCGDGSSAHVTHHTTNS